MLAKRTLHLLPRNVDVFVIKYTRRARDDDEQRDKGTNPPDPATLVWKYTTRAKLATMVRMWIGHITVEIL